MSIGTPPAFTGGIPGFDLLTNIVSGTNSYPYPGATAKASTRTDCAGSTCTYAEEMTNYANWWAYYHTRMQMIKTSASLAFQNVGANYHVGYAAMNNNQGSGFVNPAPFTATNKLAWYNKFFGRHTEQLDPAAGFPSECRPFLRREIRRQSFNGVTVTDPMQYSCQQNFAIVATDGYWNGATNPNQTNGSTAIGNQDSSEARPYNDGGGVTVTKVTPTVTTTTVTTTGRTTLDRSTRTDTTTSTTTQTATDTYAQTTVASVSRSTCSTRTQQSSYTGGTLTRTVTKVTTSSQPKEVLTTTGYTDVATSTSTSTETVVTTNGVVTSDTTAVTTTGPSTVSTVSSGPSVATNNLGSPTVTGPTTTTTSSSISWGSPTTSCVASGTSGTGPTLLTTGTLSPASPTPVVTTTTGSLTHTAGYPQTLSAGTASTVVTGPTVGATTTTTMTTGGTSNTLADTAEYYYVTDLRTAALGNCTGAPPAWTCAPTTFRPAAWMPPPGST